MTDSQVADIISNLENRAERAHHFRKIFVELDQNNAGEHTGMLSRELHCNTLGAIVINLVNRSLVRAKDKNSALEEITYWQNYMAKDIEPLQKKTNIGADGKPIHFESDFTYSPFTWLVTLVGNLHIAAALGVETPGSVNLTNSAFQEFAGNAMHKEFAAIDQFAPAASRIKERVSRYTKAIAEFYVPGVDPKEFVDCISLPLKKITDGTEVDDERKQIAASLLRILDTISQSITSQSISAEQICNHAQTH